MPTAGLVLSRASLRELETNTSSGQSPIDFAIGLQSIINTTSLLLIQDDLQNFRAILSSSCALADDFNGVDQVSEDCIVDSGKCSRAGALLGE